LNDREMRGVFTSILKTLENLVVRVNEANNTAHSLQMVIADIDPATTTQIRERYSLLEKTTQPMIEQVTAGLRKMILQVNADPRRDLN
jgi:hypothetical protein